MIWLAALLKGDTLGRTLYNVLALLAVLAFVGLLGMALVFGKGWSVQRVKTAEARAGERVQAQAAENNAAAAANASATRAAVDSAIIQVRVTTDQTAARIEDAKHSVGPDGALPDDILRELDAATRRATAAGDRLQRTGAR